MKFASIFKMYKLYVILYATTSVSCYCGACAGKLSLKFADSFATFRVIEVPGIYIHSVCLGCIMCAAVVVDVV